MARDYPDSFAPDPIDRVAGRVISRGYHHEFKKAQNNREVWDAPPDTVPTCYTPEPIKSLMGQRKGCLVVIGYLGRRHSQFGKKRGQILLVRCDCGRHEERVAQRWRKRGNEIFEMCQFCNQRERLKTSHLSNAERDRLENLNRARHGLPSKHDEMSERLKRKLVNFYSRGRDPNQWKKHRHKRLP